jgi:iron complex outermembrane receptor protein
LALLCAFALTPAGAQEREGAEGVEGAVEEITVTGSRIRRDEFSSPSPIQVLDVESGRQLGISSISEMLQRATVATGQQIDATLNTNAGNSNATEAPPTGGVGSSSIDLRGLGPERTLILVNGRRMGSVGVRGAPAQPALNLIPFSMVDRAEVLTEGVSAVYGADAVAGVVNVILREDFAGFAVTLNTELPNDDGGEIGQISKGCRIYRQHGGTGVLTGVGGRHDTGYQNGDDRLDLRPSAAGDCSPCTPRPITPPTPT